MLKQIFFITCFCLFAPGFAQVNENAFWTDTQSVSAETTSHVVAPVIRKTPVKYVAPVVPEQPQEELYTISFDSLFSAQEGSVEEDIYVRNTTAEARDYRFAIILLLMLAYVTWIVSTFHKQLRENITVLINNNLGQQIYRDREFSANIFKLITFINFAVLTGIFLYLAAGYFGVELVFGSMVPDMALCIGVVFVAYLLKGLVYRIADGLYQFGPAIWFFRFNSLVTYQLLGIGLLPMVILSVFAKPPLNGWALTATIVLILFGLFVRLVKGISVVGMLKGFRFLYFLLYICALEIAPVLLVYKVFERWA